MPFISLNNEYIPTEKLPETGKVSKVSP